MVGQFSLGLAIASPVLMFTNLHLRAVQATDARRSYSFVEYFRLRVVMTAAALTVIAIIAWCEHYEGQTTAIILIVALAKGIETLSDIHYGLFQLNDRLDQTSRSMMLRGASSLIALGAGLYFTHNLFLGCVGVVVVWLADLLLFDWQHARRLLEHSEKAVGSVITVLFSTGNVRQFQRQWHLMRLALPLGIVTTLASINVNMPRYFIEAKLGEHQLGIFSALVYATVGVTLVSDSLGNCAIPCMSRLYAEGRIAEFRAVLLKLSAGGSALGLIGVAVALLAGKTLLSAFYSPEYSAVAQIFTVLMFAAAINCLAGMLISGILSARYFRLQVPLFLIVAAASALACYRLVPLMGLKGGAIAMVVGAIVRLILAASVALFLFFVAANRLQGPVRSDVIDQWSLSL